MQTLYIVRHGKTDWNIKGLAQGRIDISLNEEGIESAKKLANELDINKIDICISSPLKRAKETAEILVKGKKNIIFDERLKERSLGDFEGKRIDFDIILKHWNYNLNDCECGIESIKDCLDRAKDFLNDIKIKYPNKRILIVSHGGFMKALHYNIEGYDENTDFLSFNPQNITLYKYEID